MRLRKRRCSSGDGIVRPLLCALLNKPEEVGGEDVPPGCQIGDVNVGFNVSKLSADLLADLVPASHSFRSTEVIERCDSLQEILSVGMALICD